MKKYAVSRLNKVAEIGKTVNRKTGAGINVSTFEPTGTLFYGSYNRTVTQTYQITGTDVEDTIAIVVRHTDTLNDSILVRLAGIVYAIQSIAYDDDIHGFDVVTLKKEKGAH
ncbi:head-tail adaptor protein [Schleiferilactobacillus harbinensis]|uniref:phage head closure protein n=1 Tax=Schleiferilactobacillus harbinensis TaxID=304207 RepID=UPI00123ABEF7|nr:phage head closure protein [Schleiferilactobacillus harbinensis]QEU48015.1 head-tail adaptor protein [Schleiferilactobacillus harbinensis]